MTSWPAKSAPSNSYLDAPFDGVRDDEQSTLPPVWLNSHAYQNVTAIVTRRPATRTDGRKPPSSRKKVGRCQPATSGARISGGNQRRVAGALQPREGDPVPARLLAQRPVRGVDQAHGEHHEEGAHGARRSAKGRPPRARR